jgi:transcriptional regulator with XRE-family HTH domain
MARKTRMKDPTTPFDVKAWIAKEDAQGPGFAAAVEAELAALNLDEKLRDLRKSHHVTQAQLATRMGVTQSAIAQLEKSDPGRMEIRTLAKMATALGYGITIKFEAKHNAGIEPGSTVVFRHGRPIEVHDSRGGVHKVGISAGAPGPKRAMKAAKRIRAAR